jgi:GNAT superfamily N-acetyltransferase
MPHADAPIELLSADLAPGDGKAAELNCRDLEIARICSSRDPLFAPAYERLWMEFGHHHTVEPREVIIQRLGWHPVTMLENCWLRYEMILVRREGQFVAVRDHTAIVTRRRRGPEAVVHLSHVLVDAAWRRTGLAGWLRTWPLQTARTCLMAAGFSADSPLTLVAEMEHADPQFPERSIRLQAYEKAGFKKVDPRRVNYLQPDFRPPEEIDAGGGPQLLPFALILRRVGREEQRVIRGAEVREIVECLYRMYGAGFRSKDMTVAWQSLNEYPAAEAEIPLLAPTQ